MSDSGGPVLTPILEAQELIERGIGACVGPPPVVLEIGFGRAELVLALAEAHPEWRFLGVEVSRKRVQKAGRRVAKKGLPNLRLVHAPAEYLLERALPEGSIADCWLNCPDPWPKKRHHKRRVVTPGFALRLARVMVPGAFLHVSTDDLSYAGWIHEVMSETPGFRNLHAPEPWSKTRPPRPETAYEAEAVAEGRSIAYFDFVREPGPGP